MSLEQPLPKSVSLLKCNDKAIQKVSAYFKDRSLLETDAEFLGTNIYNTYDTIADKVVTLAL